MLNMLKKVNEGNNELNEREWEWKQRQ